MASSQHRLSVIIGTLVCLFAAAASGYDISGIKPTAFGLPELNAVVRPSSGATPYSGTDDELSDFSRIRLVLDTGASGLVIFEKPSLFLGLPIAEFAGDDVVFEDVGIGGSTLFNVSDPLHLSVGRFDMEPSPPYNPATENIDFPRQYSNIRAQLGPPGFAPWLGGLYSGALRIAGIAGMPILENKITVIQPRFAEQFLLGDTIRSYLYEQNLAALSGPGILPTNLDIALTLKAFNRFTKVTPGGAPVPTLSNNPFIGPDPLAALEGQNPLPTNPPGVLIAYNGRQAEGSFLLDTGNQTSSISKQLAALLGVRFKENTEGTETPILENFDPDNPEAPGVEIANQFTSVVQGIGGQETIVGFYLDSLQLKTRQGNANDDNDPNHINYLPAPVYIQDVTLQDPLTLETFTIAGIIGMNYLMASFEGALPLFLSAGPFETLVLNFDQNHANANTLGLYAADFTPVAQPASTQVPFPFAMLLTVAAIILVSGLFALRKKQH